eukprot:scaffold111170_cov30-Tisochrysis_lutea.AAC.2
MPDLTQIGLCGTDLLKRLKVPQPDGPVGRRSRHEKLGRVDGKGANRSWVHRELMQHLARGEVPQFDDAVVAAGDDPPAVWREEDVAHTL